MGTKGGNTPIYRCSESFVKSGRRRFPFDFRGNATLTWVRCGCCSVCRIDSPKGPETRLSPLPETPSPRFDSLRALVCGQGGRGDSKRRTTKRILETRFF